MQDQNRINSRKWTVRPIFVSSTFRDMHAERDYLRAHVFPEIAHRLRGRFHRLEIIDLRQGVETADIGSEAERDLEVLQVCLREIERSRPFFIGLIGDRYGWTPPADRMKAAVEQVGFHNDIEGISVTELEVRYGALESNAPTVRAWFYLRERLPYGEMQSEVAEAYQGPVHVDGECPTEQLKRLKSRLQSDPRTRDRVRGYSAAWKPTENCIDYDSLKVWGDRVFEDLWQDLDEDTKAQVRAAPATWQEIDRELLESFVDDRLAEFVGREAFTRDLLEYALRPDNNESPQAVYVQGEPGSGKSSLFGNVYRELQGGKRVVLAHAAGIFAGSDSIERMQRRWIFELSQFQRTLNNREADDAVPQLATPSDVMEEFARLLHEVSRSERIVILADGLNQFLDASQATSLTWLPSVLPSNVRVIVTALSKFTGGDLVSNVETKHLPPFSQEEGRSFAKLVYQRYHRQPSQESLRVLFDKKRESGEPASGNPLWLRLALDSLNLMEGDDFARADQEFASLPAHRRITALVTREAEQFPAELRSAFGTLVERPERHFGAGWVRALLDLIAVSRNGWRNTDLQQLIPLVAGVPWSDLTFAGIRRFLGSQLVERGATASWTFLHEQLHEAVRERISSDKERRTSLHRQIVEHLLQLPADDEVRQSETMHHLLASGDQVACAKYLAGLGNSNPALPYAATSIAEECLNSPNVILWAGDGHYLEEDGQLEKLLELAQGVPELFGDLGQDPSFGPARGSKLRVNASTSTRFVTGMLTVDGLSHDEIIEIARVLQNELHVASGCLRQILQSCKPAIERVLSENPEHVGAKAELFRNKYRFGSVLLMQGSTDDAWSLLNDAYRAASNIEDERTCDLIAEDVAACLSRLASAEVRMRKLADARLHQEHAIRRLDGLRTAGTLSQAGFENLVDTMFEYGNTLSELGEIEDARKAFERTAVVLNDYPGGAARRAHYSFISLGTQGNLDMKSGDFENALINYRRAFDLCEELLRKNPLGPAARHRVGFCRGKIANALMGLGRYEEAVESSRLCVAVSDEIINDDRASFELREQNIVDRGRLARALLKAKRLEEAFVENTEVIHILEGWVETDSRNFRSRERLALAYRQGGSIQQELRNQREAAKLSAQGLLVDVQAAALGGAQQKNAKSLVEDAAAFSQQLLSFDERDLTIELLRSTLSLFENPGPVAADIQLHYNVGVCQQLLGEALLTNDDLDGSYEAFDQARKTLMQVASLTRQETPAATYMTVVSKWLEVRHRQYLADAGRVSAVDLCQDGVTLGDGWRSRGDIDQAVRCFEIALSVCKSKMELGDDADLFFVRSASIALERLGDCALMKREFPRADNYFRECLSLRLAIHKAVGDSDSTMTLGTAFGRCGAALAQCSRIEESLVAHDQAAVCFENVISKAGYLYDGMNALYYLGGAYFNIASLHGESKLDEMMNNLLMACVIFEYLEAHGYPIDAEIKNRFEVAKDAFDRLEGSPQMLQNARSHVFAQLGIPRN